MTTSISYIGTNGFSSRLIHRSFTDTTKDKAAALRSSLQQMRSLSESN